MSMIQGKVRGVDQAQGQALALETKEREHKSGMLRSKGQDGVAVSEVV